MNKKTSLIILIALIVVIIIAIAIFGITKLFQSKEAISTEKFKSIMEGKEFVIVDAKSQFSSIDYVKNAYIATKSDYSYQIEFYEISDESNAVSFYNNNKDIFLTYKTTGTAESNVSAKNYSKYTLKTSDKYRVLSRIDNTVLYVSVDIAYKDEVEGIIKNLGY